MSAAQSILKKFEATTHKTFKSEDLWRAALPKSNDSGILKIQSVFGRLVAKWDGSTIGTFDLSSGVGNIDKNHLPKSVMDDAGDVEDIGKNTAEAFMDKL